ncbi:MAG: ABC transporter permease [Ruminococcaceae bacterium]|nr:ABC transporter permease [Oscillospiraceae bacterium]
MKTRNKSAFLSLPYIIFMVVFTLIPLGVVAYYALTDPSTGEFTLDNLMNLSEFLPVLGRSVLYSLISAVICLVLGYPVAYYIAHRGQVAQKILYMLIMLPMCMSFLLRTLAWVGLLQDTGIINNFLDWIGIGRLQLIRTPGAVVLGMVYNYLPYMILPLYSIIVKIDNRLIEAAEDLGCTPAQTFLRVVLPLSVPGILSGMTMVFVPAVSTFYISQKLGGGQDTVMIGDLIERQFKQADNPNLGAALSLVLMALVFLCTGLMNRFGGDEEGVVV